MNGLSVMLTDFDEFLLSILIQWGRACQSGKNEPATLNRKSKYKATRKLLIKG